MCDTCNLYTKSKYIYLYIYVCGFVLLSQSLGLDFIVTDIEASQHLSFLDIKLSSKWCAITGVTLISNVFIWPNVALYMHLEVDSTQILSTLPKKCIYDQNSNIIHGKCWNNFSWNHYHKLTLHPIFKILVCLVKYHFFYFATFLPDN